jgi:hypothetical protein
MSSKTTPKDSVEGALDTAAISRLSGLTPKYFESKRSKGAVGNSHPGPPYYKIGRAVRYPAREFFLWLDAHRVEPTPEARAKQRCAP